MKITHKFYLILLTFVLSSQLAYSQVVKGSVEDSAGDPVEGYILLVSIDDYDRTVVLNGWQEISPNGNYQFNGQRIDTNYIIGYPNDPWDYVPTFYPASLDWSGADPLLPTKAYPKCDVEMQQCNGGDNFSGFSIPLSGTIINKDFLKSLMDATIFVKRNNELISYIRTDFDGTFELDLSTGEYEISATKFGYQKETKIITINENNSRLGLNFELIAVSVNPEQNFVFPTLAELKSGKFDNQRLSLQTSNFMLAQNYPNPFNPVTNITFDIPENANVVLNVYDLSGKEIATLVNEYKSAGSYSVTFDASNLSTGVYIYKLTSNNTTVVKRMMLIK